MAMWVIIFMVVKRDFVVYRMYNIRSIFILLNIVVDDLQQWSLL